MGDWQTTFPLYCLIIFSYNENVAWVIVSCGEVDVIWVQVFFREKKGAWHWPHLTNTSIPRQHGGLYSAPTTSFIRFLFRNWSMRRAFRVFHSCLHFPNPVIFSLSRCFWSCSGNCCQPPSLGRSAPLPIKQCQLPLRPFADSSSSFLVASARPAVLSVLLPCLLQGANQFLQCRVPHPG